MTDINNVISKINHYQYDIKKEALNKLTKLDTRDFIGKEYKILESLYNKKNDEVAKEIKTLLKMDTYTDKEKLSKSTDNFLEEIEHINKASMVYDKSLLINLNCKYHVFYSGENINIKNITSYNHKPLDINEGNNIVILDKHNTHARIINYDSNEVNYIDIPRRNFALSPEKLIRGSEYTLDDEVNDVNKIKMKCDDKSNVPWLCNGLHHSMYHSLVNMKDSYNFNIVVPMININYYTFINIIENMIKDTSRVTYHYFEILNNGGIVKNESKFNAPNDCAVSVIKKDNAKITYIGLVLFDRINYIHNIFKDDISDDYNDVIDQFIDDDTFNKIKNNYTKFPNFVYKMCCLNFAIKYYSTYETRIDHLYYAAKLVFFSCFNCYFNGKINKKNITELTNNEQIKSVYFMLREIKDYDMLFAVNVDDSNRDWLNLDDLIKFKYTSGNHKTYTGNIKLPNFIDNNQDKLEEKDIHDNLEEIRDEIKRLHTAHDDFKTMINEIIENDSIPKANLTTNTMDTIKHIIGNNTKKLVCIPVFCMNRYTSSINYKLMESVINNINKKIKEKAGVKEDTL